MSTTMQAAVCRGYGGPETVAIETVPRPIARSGEVLVRIMATTVSAGDARVRAAHFPRGFAIPARLALGLLRPRRPILGTEFAGIVEAVGPHVSTFNPGDRIFAYPGGRFGGHAEFAVMPADGAISPMPAGFDFDEAAAIAFGGSTALHFLTALGKLAAGERLLVNGASGAVGSAAVQIGRHLGAHVTAVTSAANAELVTSLGAAEVIDYRVADFAASGSRWNVVFDAVGNATHRRVRPILAPGGRLLMLVASLGDLVGALLRRRRGDHQVIAGVAPERAEDLATLKALCESGAFRPLIDRRYRFAEIAAAHARVDSGHKRGSVVVTVP